MKFHKGIQQRCGNTKKGVTLRLLGKASEGSNFPVPSGGMERIFLPKEKTLQAIRIE